MTLATIVAFAAEETEHTGNVALETVGFGITALLIFGTLANRHSHKAEAYARAHADDVQQAGHGH